MSNFYWTNIISFNGSQNNAFEELVCQLAEKENFKNKEDFIKKGNPDAGVECYVILNNKQEICFQAKWFLSTPQKSQWKQIKKSFETALKKHPYMTKYYIAIPLDRADPRNDTKLSFMDRWNINTKKWKKIAQSKYNKNISFVYWGSFELIKRLKNKENEDIKDFFFPSTFSKKEINNYLKENVLFNINHSFKKYKIIDLFAGIGGTRLGFENAFRLKANFVFSSERDKFAQETYNENFGENPKGDIREIEENEIPPFDILLTDFHCLESATLVPNKTRLKPPSFARSLLFFDIVRIVKYHKPQVIFFKTIKECEIKFIKHTLEELGYKVFADILNAKDFGVPQNRKSLYIIAFLDHSIEFEFPKPLDKVIKVGDILEEYVDDKYTLSNEQWNRYKRNHIYQIYNKESDYTNTFLPYYLFRFLIEQKDKNPRKLSPREVARLQGFPDNFKIVGNDIQAYKQFGYSSTVTVVSALAKNILKALDKCK